MTETTTRWRYFFAHEDSKQEAWLDAHARRGLRLVRPGLFTFTFAQAAPSDEKYRLDFQLLRGRARQEYLDLFGDAGWEFLGQVANRYYFRARPDALSPEIFSDAESRKDRIRRQMRVGGAITSLLMFQMSIGVSRLVEGASNNVALMTVVAAGAFACFGAWMLWQMEQSYKALR